MDTTQVEQQAMTLITTWGLRVLGAIAFLVIGWAIARWLGRTSRRVLERSRADPTLVPFVAGLVYWFTIAFVIIAVLGIFGVPTASLVAVLGAIGLAVGLALQGTLSSFASGVLLLVLRLFRVGDFVEVAGVSGKVHEIGIFVTVLHTPDNVRVTVPNSEVFGDVIRNYTGNDTRRIDLMVGVGYDDDLQLAHETMERVLAREDGVLDDPEPVVAVHELGSSSVNFVVRPWVRTKDYWRVRWDLTRALKEELEAAGCSIPYPQHDVHLFDESGGGAAAEAAA